MKEILLIAFGAVLGAITTLLTSIYLENGRKPLKGIRSFFFFFFLLKLRRIAPL